MNQPFRVPGGPRWIRWGESTGKTPWRLCIDVVFMDGWLLLQPAEGPDLAIPQHLIRGHVEMSDSDPRSDQ